MAISSVAKNFRDGTVTIADGAALNMTLNYTGGDFSVNGLVQGQTEVAKYMNRGAFFSARKTTQTFPTFSFTAILTDVSDGTNKTLQDAFLKLGAWASAQSTLGVNADVYTLNLTWTIEGTDHGDPADHEVVMGNCRVTDLSMSEGDPDMINISGEILGSITLT